MAGAPPDWFSTGEWTAAGEPTAADDDASATGEFDFGRIDTSPVALPTVGATLGRYRLEALVGEGAMGQVWRARDPQLDRAVAIKVVHPSIAAGPDGGPRLLREARAMAKLSHPNVVTVYDAGDDAGRLFVAMDLVVGTTLGEWLRGRDGVRDWRAALARFRDAGRGLAAAHAAGSAARPRTTAVRSQRGTASSAGAGRTAPRSIASTSAAMVMAALPRNGCSP